MLSEKEFKKYEEVFDNEESEMIRKENLVEKIYEIIEYENICEIFPNYNLQDEELTQAILEVYKILFWGLIALVSTLLWLYFFLN